MYYASSCPIFIQAVIEQFLLKPLYLNDRFTVVTRTKHTKLPTGADKYRIASVSHNSEVYAALTSEMMKFLSVV